MSAGGETRYAARWAIGLAAGILVAGSGCAEVQRLISVFGFKQPAPAPEYAAHERDWLASSATRAAALESRDDTAPLDRAAAPMPSVPEPRETPPTLTPAERRAALDALIASWNEPVLEPDPSPEPPAVAEIPEGPHPVIVRSETGEEIPAAASLEELMRTLDALIQASTRLQHSLERLHPRHPNPLALDRAEQDPIP